ncbi:MAG: CoA ester lyase [Lawsonibacter sp.]|nr:CoA ester lyase [Lawsonibacter sp.]
MLRLRRSTMNVPGNDYDKIQSVLQTDVDVVMMDLEDAVPESQKDIGRAITVKALRELDFGKRVRCVRINGWETPYARQDVEQVVAAGAEEIKLTKCEAASQVEELDQLLTRCEQQNGIPAQTVKISMMIESPLGVLNAYQIMAASPRVVAVSLGAGDLASALGVDRDLAPCSQQFLHVKQQLTLCARAAGVRWILDTSLVARKGESPTDAVPALLEDCIQVKMMGFNGRSAIYPEHIAPINQVFSPSEEETRFARRAVQTWEQGLAQGDVNSLVVDGRHLDIGKYEKARELLELSDAILSQQA